MTRTVRFAEDCFTALLLAAALALGGILLADRVLDGVTESSFYRQSKIIRSIFSEEEELGLSGLLTNTQNRSLLLKFAGALANAYVTFEFIPYNEAQTFSAVLHSYGSDVGIDNFVYQRKNLIILGTSSSETAYREFLHKLRQQDRFSEVTGHSYITRQDELRFEIKCIPTD